MVQNIDRYIAGRCAEGRDRPAETIRTFFWEMSCYMMQRKQAFHYNNITELVEAPFQWPAVA